MDEAQFKALPLAQRKAHQERLQSLGLYAGPIDGNWGSGTKAAFEGEKKRLADDAERARKGKIEEQSATADAELKTATAKGELAKAAEEERKTKARKERDDTAASGLGMLARTLAGAPAALGGVWAGREMGKGINYYMDESQKSKNATLRGLADDRRAGLTTPKGARAAARISGAMPSQNSVLRVGSRMLPHAALGAFMGGKGALMLSQEDPEGAFYPETVNRAAALGMLGAGTGIAERGIMYGVSPGQVPDAQAIGVIESDQLRRAASKSAPGASAPTPRAVLVEQAKAAGIKNIAKKNMTQLQAALKALPKPGVLAPLAAGAVAFGATPNRAEASPDGTSGSNMGERLTNAGLAGGATVAAGSGLSRLGRALKSVAPGAVRVAGRVLPPVAAGLTAYDAFNAIDSLAHLSPPQDPSEYSTMGAFMPPEAAAPEPQQPGGDLDALISAAEQDPEIAAMIQQMIQERLTSQPAL